MPQTANYGFPLLADTPPEGMTGKDLRNMILGENETSLSQMMDAALKSLSDSAQTKGNIVAEYHGVDGFWSDPSSEEYPSTKAVDDFVHSIIPDPMEFQFSMMNIYSSVFPSLGMVNLDTITWDGSTDGLPSVLGMLYKVSDSVDQPDGFRLKSSFTDKVSVVVTRDDTLMDGFGIALYFSEFIGNESPVVVANQSGTLPATVIEQIIGKNPGADVPYEAGTYLYSAKGLYITSTTGLMDAKTYIDQRIAKAMG